MNHLFLIGINKYADAKISDLKACVKDVQDFKDILIDKYDFDASRVLELYDEEATNLKIQDALVSYVKALDKNSNLIIYYSGHGAYDEKTDRGFWVTYDSKQDYSTFIPNEVLLGLIQKIRAKHIFLIADCCFSWSIFVKDASKAIIEFVENPSRIVLASGRGHTYEVTDNNVAVNIFSKSIIDYFLNAKNDFRVGSLIESVKHQIGSDVRQTPQGARLLDSNDKGGEFIFKIINHDFSATKSIKGNKEISTILKIFTKGRELKEYPAYEDKSANVGFKLFEELSSGVYKRKHYFLYLYKGTNQTKTFNAFKDLNLELKYNLDKQIQNLTVLLPKEKGQITDTRKTNINNLFKPISIFYLEEFIRDECTPRKEVILQEDDERYFIPNFILPKFEIGNIKYDNPSILKEWLNKEHEPIMVIKGTGGIGKTTFSQFIANEFIEQNKKSSVIFIDSLEIKNELLKKEKTKESITLYNFYIALQESNGERLYTLSEELFRLNLDAGNILIIIDGLDEVISKVPFFEAETFLKSITNYSAEIGNAKVIITCRSYFWETSKYGSNQILTIDLLPFSLKQTTNFFEKSFKEETRKKQKALSLAEEFQYPDELGNPYFHPYVLEVIKTIIESENEVTTYSPDFDSKILNQNVKSDYIIYRICYRERFYKDKIRILPLEVDEQLMFFSYWAIKRRGVIKYENFGMEMKNALGKSFIDNTTIEAFKSHPFVHTNKYSISFKFDFFADYFKCIYVSEFLKLESENLSVTDDFIKILVENCWYGSGMIKDIVNRLKSWSDDEILKCSDLINQILVYINLEVNLKRKALSGLFNVCLAANKHFKSNDVGQNTNLIIALFGNGNIISGLHMQNIHDSEEKIRFDFSNLILKDCYIENFTSFWDCNFNKKTFFVDSFLLGLSYNVGNTIELSKEQFQNCTKDEAFDNAYNINQQNKEKTDEQIKRNLTSFFNIFYRGGKLEPHNYDESYRGHETIRQIYAKLPNQVVSLKVLINYLVHENVIQWDKINDADIIKISNEFKPDVLTLIKNGTITGRINKLIIGLKEALKTK